MSVGAEGDILFDNIANYLVVNTESNDKVCNVNLFGKATWYPGFTRKLGSKGRYDLLKLIRNKCNSNDECKQIFKTHNPPISAGKLSFYRVEFLWKIAHMIGVFDEALLMYNTRIKKSTPQRRLDTLVNRPASNIKDLEMQLKNSHQILSNAIPGRISKFEFEIIDQLNRFYNIIKMKLSITSDGDSGTYRQSLLHSLNSTHIPNLCDIAQNTLLTDSSCTSRYYNDDLCIGNNFKAHKDTISDVK